MGEFRHHPLFFHLRNPACLLFFGSKQGIIDLVDIGPHGN
jgi:hypothetical protein